MANPVTHSSETVSRTGDTSRRGFLRSTSAAAAAATAAPLILPRWAAAQGANDKRTVGAIGVGGRGSEIANQAATFGKMIACCDVDSRNAQRFAEYRKQNGDEVKTYTDYREMLEGHPDLDVVIIGTPDHWHVKIAIEAMRAGKHVYCEKPLTLTIEEGEMVKKAVDKYGKVFQVGTQQRSEFDRNFLTACAIARSGRLGDKLSAVSSVGAAASRSDDKDHPFGPFKTTAVPEHLDWDLWQGPALEREFSNERVGWNFRWWFEYSGGQVTDWGVHHTDIAFWALGGEEGQAVAAEPKAAGWMGVDRETVLGMLTGKVPPKQVPQSWNVAHTFDVDVTLSTGNVIKIVSGPNELVLEGERGKIRVNRGSLTGKPAEELQQDAKLKSEVDELMVKIYGRELPEGPHQHMRNFFDSIASETQPVANVHDHVRAVNACHLANIALLVNRRVEFDPKSVACPGDEVASQLIARRRREKYDFTV